MRNLKSSTAHDAHETLHGGSFMTLVSHAAKTLISGTDQVKQLRLKIW